MSNSTELEQLDEEISKNEIIIESLIEEMGRLTLADHDEFMDINMAITDLKHKTLRLKDAVYIMSIKS